MDYHTLKNGMGMRKVSFHAQNASFQFNIRSYRYGILGRSCGCCGRINLCYRVNTLLVNGGIGNLLFQLLTPAYFIGAINCNDHEDAAHQPKDETGNKRLFLFAMMAVVVTRKASI